jgi:hypothetical protein
MLSFPAVGLRTCLVTYVDHRQIKHGAEVQAESLYEAAVLAVKLFRADPWLEKIGPATVLEVEIREPTTKHAISLQQVERWLAGATTNPNEASRKAKLKTILVQR